MLRPMINAHVNIIFTDSGGVWRRVWINGEGWYVHCGGCDGWWRKMVLTVVQMCSGVI